MPTFLPFKSAIVFMLVSLRTQKAPRSGCSEPIRRMLGLDCLACSTSKMLDTELSFAATDQRDEDGFARGRLHDDVCAGLFLEHLGDRRGRRVVERPRLHGGEAVGLRSGDTRAEHKRREPSCREDGSSEYPNVKSDHCLSSQLVVSGYNGSDEALAPPLPYRQFC